MFSIAPMPRTSFAPMPPIPMQATLSLSLGATWRRPRTWDGTIVKAAVVDATSPTNVRRSIGLSLGIGLSPEDLWGSGETSPATGAAQCIPVGAEARRAARQGRLPALET